MIGLLDALELQVNLVLLLDGFQAALLVGRLYTGHIALAHENGTLFLRHLFVDGEEGGGFLSSEVGFLGNEFLKLCLESLW